MDSFKRTAGGAPLDARYALARDLPRIVKALPTTKHTGDVVQYVATAAATGAYQDAVWNFTYNAAAGYWYNSGSSPLIREIDTQETTTSTSYVDLATVGPRITLPFIGDYLFFYGALIVNSGAGNVSAMSLDFGPGALDIDNVLVLGANNASVHRQRAKTIVAASTAITAKYRVTPAGTGTFEKRFLNILPLRVK